MTSQGVAGSCWCDSLEGLVTLRALVVEGVLEVAGRVVVGDGEAANADQLTLPALIAAG